jgi:protein-disulfide isomerase
VTSKILRATRSRLAGAMAFALLAIGGAPALADDAASAPKPTGMADMAKALEAGPLPELALGDAKGVPVIEYGSVTCPHCAHFDKDVWPAFKASYVDTGKVRYIFREYSRNQLDVAAFVLARCSGDDKAFATIQLLFARQDDWAFVDNPLPALVDVLKPTGLTENTGQTCLQNQAKINQIVDIAKSAEQNFSIRGTPAFIIDGKMYGGALSLAQLDAILKPLIK